jgi:hypothetical protein
MQKKESVNRRADWLIDTFIWSMGQPSRGQSQARESRKPTGCHEGTKVRSMLDQPEESFEGNSPETHAPELAFLTSYRLHDHLFAD